MMASPSPSMRPRIAMFTPVKLVTKSGQIAKIMSEPMSFKKDAHEKVRTIERASFD